MEEERNLENKKLADLYGVSIELVEDIRLSHNSIQSKYRTIDKSEKISVKEFFKKESKIQVSSTISRDIYDMMDKMRDNTGLPVSSQIELYIRGFKIVPLTTPDVEKLMKLNSIIRKDLNKLTNKMNRFGNSVKTK